MTSLYDKYIMCVASFNVLSKLLSLLRNEGASAHVSWHTCVQVILPMGLEIERMQEPSGEAEVAKLSIVNSIDMESFVWRSVENC